MLRTTSVLENSKEHQYLVICFRCGANSLESKGWTELFLLSAYPLSFLFPSSWQGYNSLIPSLSLLLVVGFFILCINQFLMKIFVTDFFFKDCLLVWENIINWACTTLELLENEIFCTFCKKYPVYTAVLLKKWTIRKKTKIYWATRNQERETCKDNKKVEWKSKSLG